MLFKRVDRLAIEPPIPQPGPRSKRSPGTACGKFGEMSTLNNYMFQSFNFRAKVAPLYIVRYYG